MSVWVYFGQNETKNLVAENKTFQFFYLKKEFESANFDSNLGNVSTQETFVGLNLCRFAYIPTIQG